MRVHTAGRLSVLRTYNDYRHSLFLFLSLTLSSSSSLSSSFAHRYLESDPSDYAMYRIDRIPRTSTLSADKADKSYLLFLFQRCLPLVHRNGSCVVALRSPSIRFAVN